MSKNAAENIDAATMDREEMVTYPTEAFLSREYLHDEKKLLWPKIWQMVERETDLPNPGDWMTYDVAEESIVILRKDDGTLNLLVGRRTSVGASRARAAACAPEVELVMVSGRRSAPSHPRWGLREARVPGGDRAAFIGLPRLQRDRRRSVRLTLQNAC